MTDILYLNVSGEISGAERSLLAMLDALDRDLWTPTVAAPDGPLLAEVEARRVRTMALPLPPLRRPRNLREWLKAWDTVQATQAEVRRALRFPHPALVHANSSTAMLYALGVSGPLIWQARDLVSLNPVGNNLYRRAKAVAVISSAVRDSVRAYANDGGAKMVMLPPAVDTEHFRPAADKGALRLRLGIPPDTPLIGMVAQFVPWKRHDIFLDMLGRLPTGSWRAVLAGADISHDEEYLEHIRTRLMTPALQDRALLLPWQDDPAPLIAALDLLILPSAGEPFGRVLIEAMACAVPVIAIDDVGPRDIVQDSITGRLMWSDPVGMAAVVKTLLADPARCARLGEAGRARAVEHFSLPVHRAALTALYESVLPRRR